MRKRSRLTDLPPEEVLSDLDDAEDEVVERLDGADYRDDVLRLLFICCHPDLPATQQIALALRIVSGLSVKQIARAFLVSRSGHGAAHHPGQGASSAEGDVAFETPGAAERAERLAAVAAMVYLVFNEGYSAGRRPPPAPQLCDEAIRLAPAAAAPLPDRAGDHGPDGADAAAARPRPRPLRRRGPDRAAGGPGPQPLERHA